MDNEDREFVLSAARAHIELHNEVLALRALVQKKLNFSEEEYAKYLQSVREARDQLRRPIR